MRVLLIILCEPVAVDILCEPVAVDASPPSRFRGTRHT